MYSLEPELGNKRPPFLLYSKVTTAGDEPMASKPSSLTRGNAGLMLMGANPSLDQLKGWLPKTSKRQEPLSFARPG